jgi:hypothetical protein
VTDDLSDGIAAERPRRNHRAIEVMSLMVMAVATIGSAWCAYQASQWNGEEARLGRQASEERVTASQRFALATQTLTYDTSTISQYAKALADEQVELADFVRSSIAREDFVPILDEWRVTVAAGGTPTRLLDDEEYLATLLGPYETSLDAAEELADGSDAANNTADSYVLVTLLLATVLFFAGITNSFRDRGVRLVLLAGAGVTLAYAASRLADLPVF